ncbi:MAG: LLM class flavin-dependent oxidoreductase [Alphaproteobacteria bacterium]|nr:LLM class flavin-dependent oxidoreductase [Alphaproteobacteria bacterium]
MEFNHFLSAYYPDTRYGGDKLIEDMLDQARLADRLGYASVSIPEHHLINILLNPAPLMMAVRLASETHAVKIMTSIAVLPIHDMRIFAGEVVMADILTQGRLILGVGRGAFAYELARLGAPIEESRARFDESLAVLRALLNQEEVSWSGEYYNFDPITIMPRPVRPIQMMMAVMAPPAIHACTKQGFHIQTTPLMGSNEKMLEQVGAFHSAKAEMGENGKDLTLSLSRVVWLAKNESDRAKKLDLAHEYYARFDNVFTGPGEVKNGAITALPRTQTKEELAQNLLIATESEMIDKLAIYAEAGVDEIIFSQNIGTSNAETLENMERIAEKVMPHFSDRITLAAE